MKLLLLAVIAVAIVLIPTLPRTLVCFYPAKNQGPVHYAANAMLALSEEETKSLSDSLEGRRYDQTSLSVSWSGGARRHGEGLMKLFGMSKRKTNGRTK